MYIHSLAAERETELTMRHILLETNIAPEKNGILKRKDIFQLSKFRCYFVSGRVNQVYPQKTLHHRCFIQHEALDVSPQHLAMA